MLACLDAVLNLGFSVQLLHHGYIAVLSKGRHHLVVGLVTRLEAQSLHLPEGLESVLRLILLSKDLEVEIEVLEAVVTLVEEAFEGGIDVLEVLAWGQLGLSCLIVKRDLVLVIKLWEPLFDLFLH